MTARGFDVLVVGAGPSGLLAACELLRRGVRVRVVDRSPEPVTAPRALSVWPRALDVLDDLGLLDRVRRESVEITALSYFAERRPLASFGFPPDLACRTLPQHVTERLLTERLRELGGAVERGVRLLGLDGVDSAGGVTAVLEHAGGAVERVEAPYVIGADGAGSAVRRQLGIAFEGSTYEMAFALVDARISGSLPPGEGLFYQSTSGALVVVPMPGGVVRFLSVLPDGEPTATASLMQAVIDDRGPRGVRITEPVWQAVFRVHARQAAEFQRGRVFLVGDAAHVHSPAGGQGMNNGLQDAQNLGWKLAAVVHGHSPASLLASYGPERAEATRRVVRDTDLQTRAWVARGPARVVLRNALFRLLDRSGALTRWYAPVMAGRRLVYPPVRASQRPGGWTPCRLRRRVPGGVAIGAVFPRPLALAHGISGPSADPLKWTVVSVNSGPTWFGGIAAGRPWLRLRTLDNGSALGCRRAGYYLVRPDGHIAAHGHERDLDRLETELRNAFGASGDETGRLDLSTAVDSPNEISMNIVQDMKMSEGVEWALHCCLNLSWVDAGEAVTATKLAAFYDLPPAYLNKQLQALVRAGIVTSAPGPRGGFQLARGLAEITLMDVVSAIEGSQSAFRCTEIRHRGPGGALIASGETAAGSQIPCAISQAMRTAELGWRKQLASQTIADLKTVIERRSPASGDDIRRWLTTRSA